MSEKHITAYARNEVPKGRTDWARLRAMSEEEIEANAADDADNPPLTAEALAAGEVVFPQDRNKVPVYIRLDASVLAHFKARGPGYQTRINAALLAHVQREVATLRKRVGRKPLSAWEAARPSRATVVQASRATHGPNVQSSPRAG